ncbi:hypothetical protein C1701_01490 [Actinoalloteichus sp. AHMU CJ021]|uniref:ester cyclase n=1 Tax=Actinoalloteichus TaxID=65496 RepID=UPI000372A26F|nr:ester cyclase [Actinoalloteichus spitiensis]AUS77258.1 hypothetical protein C1701_01490 [Actinoalloteichus sp. AHMU CJ021]
MDPRQTALRHLRAWEEGDIAALTDLVDDYQDPDLPDPVSGDDLAAHAQRVLARFAGPRFTVDRVVADGTSAHVSWTLRADHRAAYLGMPATGGTAHVAGTDLLTTQDGRTEVRRAFDRMALAASLGYQPRYVPSADTERQFGISSRTLRNPTGEPEALVLTWVQVRDDDESAEVDLLSAEVMKSMRPARGFLGAATFDLGDRRFTLSAFDRPESIRAVHARPHQRAMRRFFRGARYGRAFTSVWSRTSTRDYARCEGCGVVVAVHDAATCDCGRTLPPEPLL